MNSRYFDKLKAVASGEPRKLLAEENYRQLAKCCLANIILHRDYEQDLGMQYRAGILSALLAEKELENPIA